MPLMEIAQNSQKCLLSSSLIHFFSSLQGVKPKPVFLKRLAYAVSYFMRPDQFPNELIANELYRPAFTLF